MCFASAAKRPHGRNPYANLHPPSADFALLRTTVPFCCGLDPREQRRVWHLRLACAHAVSRASHFSHPCPGEWVCLLMTWPMRRHTCEKSRRVSERRITSSLYPQPPTLNDLGGQTEILIPLPPNPQPLNDLGGQKDEKAEWMWMHS